MKTLQTSLCAGLFYLVWAPTAILKDIFTALYIPFDTQRFVNAFVAFNKNATNIVEYLKDDQSDEQSQEERPVGFRVYTQAGPGPLQRPSNPENPEEDEN